MNPYAKMSYEDARAILKTGVYGVLATVDEDGRPYGVPLSYVTEDHHIYFHGAESGHKLRNLVHDPRATFTVVAEAAPEPAHYTMVYRSVIAFGEVRMVTESKEKRKALQKLCQKYGAPADPVQINAGLPHTAVFCLEVEYLSGKANG